MNDEEISIDLNQFSFNNSMYSQEANLTLSNDKLLEVEISDRPIKIGFHDGFDNDFKQKV